MMNQSNVQFLDLPNEVLFIILKKLDNMDVLYSLLGVDNQRLDMIVQGKTFTETLNFVLTTSFDDILSIEASILDRFCANILPRIGQNIKSLILESKSMERILSVTDYPNLAELKIFNFMDKIASYYFTGKNSDADLRIGFDRNVEYIAQYLVAFLFRSISISTYFSRTNYGSHSCIQKRY
jgi:hypothetical protein